MHASRIALVVLALLVAVAWARPTVALADCGTSASCSQYTDPFGNSGATTTKHPTPTATPSPAQPAASTPAVSPIPVAGSPSAAVTPSATAATGSTTSSGAGAKTLPSTGYDAGVAVLLGAGLVLGGAALRIELRRE